ncbi:hypothetical protein ACHAXT_005887 [Thalassiosira profunda]
MDDFWDMSHALVLMAFLVAMATSLMEVEEEAILPTTNKVVLVRRPKFGLRHWITAVLMVLGLHLNIRYFDAHNILAPTPAPAPAPSLLQFQGNPWVPGWILGRLTPQEMERWISPPMVYDRTNLTELAAHLTEREVPEDQVLDVVHRRKEQQAEFEMVINGGMSANFAVRFLLRGARLAFARPAAGSNPAHHFRWPRLTFPRRAQFHPDTTKKPHDLDAVLGPREDPAAMANQEIIVAPSLQGEDAQAEEGKEEEASDSEDGDSESAAGEPEEPSIYKEELESIVLSEEPVTVLYGTPSDPRSYNYETRLESYVYDGEQHTQPTSGEGYFRLQKFATRFGVTARDADGNSRGTRELCVAIVAAKEAYEQVKRDPFNDLADPYGFSLKYGSRHEGEGIVLPPGFEGTMAQYCKQLVQGRLTVESNKKKIGWFRGYIRLVDYFIANGNFDIKKRSSRQQDGVDSTFFNWIVTQKKKYARRLGVGNYREGPLNDEEYSLLMAIGIDLEFEQSNADRGRETLLRFEREYPPIARRMGHQIPSVLAENQWVASQRLRYIRQRTARLPQRTIDALDALGFDWEFNEAAENRRDTVKKHLQTYTKYREKLDRDDNNREYLVPYYRHYPRGSKMRALSRWLQNLRHKKNADDDERNWIDEEGVMSDSEKQLHEEMMAEMYDGEEEVPERGSRSVLSDTDRYAIEELKKLGYNFYPRSHYLQHERIEQRYRKALEDLSPPGLDDNPIWDCSASDVAFVPGSRARPDHLYDFRINGKDCLFHIAIHEHRHDDRPTSYEREWATWFVTEAKKLGYHCIYNIWVNTAERYKPRPDQMKHHLEMLEALRADPQEGVHFRAWDFPKNHVHVEDAFSRKIPLLFDENGRPVASARAKKWTDTNLPLYDTVDVNESRLPPWQL